MISHEEWLHSPYTIGLLRWLEQKRQLWISGCLEDAANGNVAQAAYWSGKDSAAKDILAKIRERKTDESV